MLTINLQLKGRLVFLAGAGRVGLRKLKKILAAGAHVRVLESYANEKLLEMAQHWPIEIYDKFHPALLKDCNLVFVASSNTQLNSMVAHEARQLGLWLNIADNPEESDFFLPASIEHKDFRLSVSTLGASPALSAHIARQLRNLYGDEYGKLTSLLADLRPVILNSGLSSEQREDIFKKMASSSKLLEAVKNDDKDIINEILQSIMLPIKYKLE